MGIREIKLSEDSFNAGEVLFREGGGFTHVTIPIQPEGTGGVIV